MNRTTSTVIYTDGTIREVKPKNEKKFTLEELQGYVGGHIELVPFRSSTQVMIVNEEGKTLGLEVNSYATFIGNVMCCLLGDVIVGDVLVTDLKYLD